MNRQNNPFDASLPGGREPSKSNRAARQSYPKPCERKTRKSNRRIPEDKHRHNETASTGQQPGKIWKRRACRAETEAPETKQGARLGRKGQRKKRRKRGKEARQRQTRKERARERKVKRAKEGLNSPLPSLVCNFRGLTYSSISRRAGSSPSRNFVLIRLASKNDGRKGKAAPTRNGTQRTSVPTLSLPRFRLLPRLPTGNFPQLPAGAIVSSRNRRESLSNRERNAWIRLA